MLFISLFLLVVNVCLADTVGTVVQTTFGPIQGSITDSVLSFKGIPYASPPVGSLRWQSPQNPIPWKTTKVTTSWQAGCPQNCDLPPHTCPPKTSEDCLYLNVFTPATNLSKLVPVMVWLHGGHFDQGVGGCDLYDATTLVQTGQVVVVTLSYRLGVLGWLATYDGLTGNYGFQDQLLALKWVQANIAQFGGDPSQVTLFGQSAGGTSLRAHLVSPLSSGLFHKAIVHSDPLSLPMQDIADAQNWAVKFMNDINCADSNCLRSKNVSTLLAIQKTAEKHLDIARPLEVFLPFTPVIDKKFVPYHIFEALKAGRVNKVPLMIGSTRQDALLFVYKGIQKFMNTVQYVGIVTAIFLGEFNTVLSKYPPALWGDKRPELAVLGTDYIFTCPTRSFLANYSSLSSNPVFLFQWNHALSFDGWGPSYPYCQGVVCHGADLPYLWNPPVLRKYANFTADETVLSNQMMRYWTNFAKNGNPNVGLPVQVKWPAWDPSTLANIEFETPKNRITTRLMAPTCGFWDQLGYHWGW